MYLAFEKRAMATHGCSLGLLMLKITEHLLDVGGILVTEGSPTVVRLVDELLGIVQIVFHVDEWVEGAVVLDPENGEEDEVGNRVQEIEDVGEGQRLDHQGAGEGGQTHPDREVDQRREHIVQDTHPVILGRVRGVNLSQGADTVVRGVHRINEGV